MKRFLKHKLFFNFLIAFLICLPTLGLAQTNPGCDPDNMRCGNPPYCTFRVWCPIDNGVYLLLGIGVLYGIKVIRDQKRKVCVKDI
jgi:hypothetical protein